MEAESATSDGPDLIAVRILNGFVTRPAIVVQDQQPPTVLAAKRTRIEIKKDNVCECLVGKAMTVRCGLVRVTIAVETAVALVILNVWTVSYM
jgi:hypothetical protein